MTPPRIFRRRVCAIKQRRRFYSARSMRRGDDEHLFHGRDAVAGAVEADHAEGFHALVDGDLAHFARAGAGDDELADLVVDVHGLDDGHAPGVTGIFAAVATAAAIKLHAAEGSGLDA